jgi:hypothetical protein
MFTVNEMMGFEYIDAVGDEAAATSAPAYADAQGQDNSPGLVNPQAAPIPGKRGHGRRPGMFPHDEAYTPESMNPDASPALDVEVDTMTLPSNAARRRHRGHRRGVIAPGAYTPEGMNPEAGPAVEAPVATMAPAPAPMAAPVIAASGATDDSSNMLPLALAGAAAFAAYWFFFRKK